MRSSLHIPGRRINEQVTCVILCGGKSTRMGTDKAKIPWMGHELVDVLAQRLSSVGTVCLSVRTKQQLEEKPYRRITDRYPETGPLGGLCTVLEAVSTPLVFVTACDQPFVTAEAVDVLLSQMTPQTDAVVALGDRPNPLCALYRRQCSAVMRACLRRGDYRLRNCLQELRVEYVPAEMLPGGAKTLVNLNTTAAYQAALEEIVDGPEDAR